MRYGSIANSFVILLGVGPSFAQEPLTNIGTLTCTLTDDASDKVSKMSCGFKSATSTTEEKYEGIVRGLADGRCG